MAESDEENSTSANGGGLKSILKKHSHKRKLKLASSQKEMTGPIPKKFGDYLADHDTSSSSNKETDSEDDDDENPSPAKKKNSSQSSDSKIKKSSKKTLAITNGDDSDSRDSLILPPKPSSSKQVLSATLSESEPEDPEEVKNHQKKLQARKSRINANASTMSNANKLLPLNRTLNLTAVHNKSKFIPARLSAAPPDLLDLSSASDDDEPKGPLKYTMKGSDSEEAWIFTDKREPKRKPKKASPQKQQEEDLEEQVLSPSETTEETPENPANLSRRVASPEEDLESPPKNKTSSPKFVIAPNTTRKSQSTRVSTPQAKHLGPSKVLLGSRSSKRISRASERVVFQQASSPLLKQKESSILGTPPRASMSPRTPIRSPAREAQILENSKNGSKSPSFESEVLNTSYASANVLETAIDISSARESPALSKAKKAPPKKKSKKSLARESVKNKTKEPEVPTEAPLSETRRVLRSSKTPLSPPPRLSFAKSPERSASPSIASAVAIPTIIPGKNQLTGIRPILKQSTSGADMSKFMGPRFMTSSRVANEGDPIQYSVSYDSPTLFVVYWKLKPDTINYCRTRGETCIQVMEGEVLIEDQVYPRGHVIKIPGSSTYSVTNYSSDSDALYQVTEYL